MSAVDGAVGIAEVTPEPNRKVNREDKVNYCFDCVRCSTSSFSRNHQFEDPGDRSFDAVVCLPSLLRSLTDVEEKS